MIYDLVKICGAIKTAILAEKKDWKKGKDSLV